MPYGSAASMATTVEAMCDRYGAAVVLERGTTVKAAQQVIVDRYGSASERGGFGGVSAADGQSGRTTITLIGGPDFDVERGDMFVLGGNHYRVIMAHGDDGHQRVAVAEESEF